MDLDWHLLSISEEATSSQPPPPHPDHIVDTRPRKKKARTLRETDWEPYKDRIVQLHHVEKRPLPEVRILIEQEFGFIAEIRQYRSRLTQWKLDKNIKPDEMKAIVRRRQQRSLVETDKNNLKFRVRDQEVEPHKIERWMKRHDVMDSMLYAPSPAASTPSAISYTTMSDIGSPAAQSALSPGNVEDIVVLVDSSPSTPRQNIESPFTTLRPSTTNRLTGLKLAKIDEGHSYARRRFDMNWDLLSFSDTPKHPSGLSRDSDMVDAGKRIAQVLLSGDPRVKHLPDNGTPGYIDLSFYMQSDPPQLFPLSHVPEAISARLFIALDTVSMPSLSWVIGLDMVYWPTSRQCKVAWIDSFVRPTRLEVGITLPCDVIIVADYELLVCTWPSNDDDVERAQFFTSHFGHDAAANSLV